MRTSVRSRLPWRISSCPAACGIRCVKPSRATVSPSRTSAPHGLAEGSRSDSDDSDVVLRERGRRRTRASSRAAAATAGACGRTRSPSGWRWSMVVIHHEKCSQRQTRRRHVSEYARSAPSSPLPYQSTSASASTRTSWMARLRPFAPVGGTMCAASPARIEPPVLHRLADEAAHARDALLEDRALLELPAVDGRPQLELLPDAIVGPQPRRPRRVRPGRSSARGRGERRESSANPRSLYAYTSSSIDGATSARMPSQPNGYSRSNVRRSAGRDRRRGRRRGSRRSPRSRRTRARRPVPRACT